jgi:hypothetical protein
LVPRRDRDRAVIGALYSTLQTFVTGEFARRRPSEAITPANRSVCRPNDYADLVVAASNTAAFDEFHRRCRLVEITRTDTHVIATAYLPSRYCDQLKDAYDRMLAEHVFAMKADVKENPAMKEELKETWLEFEYKGSRYFSSDGAARLRSAQLQTICNDDGSLSISAARKR